MSTRGRGKGLNPYPVEWVRWVDSHSPEWGWTEISEARFDHSLECQSVGFLVNEAKDRITLALCVGLNETGDEAETIDLLITIPKSSITKRTRLKF